MPRNVFDQYSHPENKLSHALAVSLDADRRLLRRFLLWAIGTRGPRSRLHVSEQQRPGDAEAEFRRGEPSGLPDIWIHDSESWSVLIESKIKAPLSTPQLNRHWLTAERRGFTDLHILALTTDSIQRVPDWVHSRSWSDLYVWLGRQQRESSWATRLRDYFNVLETKMVAENYLQEGGLCVFSGIPFGPDDPYTYPEAKRLLGLVMSELRQRPKLRKQLGLASDAPGRPAITGTYRDGVWDFLRPDIGLDSPFTNYPHFTVLIGRHHCVAAVIIPNSIKAGMRHAFLGATPDDFRDHLAPVFENLRKVVKDCRGAQPIAGVLQRHFPSQRSPATVDAELEFDLRTIFDDYPRMSTGVKVQPEWVEAAHAMLTRKSSNLQAMVAVRFSYERCPETKERTWLDLVEESWLAMKPLLDRVLESGR